MVVDGEVAFVGGIDMTDYAGDRFDTSDHPARRRLGWHDVGTHLRGPAVADVDDHFELRWREVTGQPLERPAPPARAGDHTIQVVRTIANGMYDAVPRRRVPDPRELRPCDLERPQLRLPREPVPVVPGDRPACSRTSSAARRATSSGS